MGGLLAILQDHLVSDYHPGIFQSRTQDEGETPILKHILPVFFFYSLSLIILHSPLSMDKFAVLIEAAGDEFSVFMCCSIHQRRKGRELRASRTLRLPWWPSW